EDPSVRYFTLTDILDKPKDSPEVEKTRKLIHSGPKVCTLIDGQQSDGGFGVHPYQKWTGAHWRLVSLVELGIPQGFRPAVRATNLVLNWLLGEAHVRNVPQIDGRYRRCASQEGNALAVCSRLGIAQDPRVRRIAESLVEWQWPDGGWNCDRREEANDLVESKRGEDGRWRPEGYYWSLKRKTRAKLAVSNVEIVNWGRGGPNEFVTLNALRVLKDAGRFRSA